MQLSVKKSVGSNTAVFSIDTSSLYLAHKHPNYAIEVIGFLCEFTLARQKSYFEHTESVY